MSEIPPFGKAPLSNVGPANMGREAPAKDGKDGGGKK